MAASAPRALAATAAAPADAVARSAAPVVGSGAGGAVGERFVDLERQASDGSLPAIGATLSDTSDPELRSAGGRCRCPSRRRGACWATVAAAVLTLCLVFRPRDPQWDLSALNFDHALLDGLAKAFTDPAFNSTLTLPIGVVVDVYNPNFIRAHAGAGRLRVTHGSALLAEVETQPGVVHARGHSTMRAVSTSVMTPEVSKHLREVLPPAFSISPTVRGELPARVFGLISVKIHLHCTVDVSVLAILSAPATMVTGKRCSQRIGL